ncbi:protein Lines homolog 1 [Rhinophrynus dorsalis]
MAGLNLGLRELHKTLLKAAPLHHDAQKYVCLLLPQVTQLNSPVTAEQVPAEHAGIVPPPWCLRDATGLQLSLIQMLISKAKNQSTDQHVRCQYKHVVELLQEADVADKIILLSNHPYKVLSHLSSKCLSFLVLFQLQFKREVNVRWLQFCLKTLCEYQGCSSLMPCLSSLIFVCKGILRDENLQQEDILLKLLCPLDPVFEGFCSSFLTRISVTHCQTFALDPVTSSHLSCLLDLLEILIALMLKANLSFPLCRRVLSVTIPQALVLVSSSVTYSVKKHFILVLKRCLLKKAGEDFLLTPLIMSRIPEPLLEQDMTVLVMALLNTVRNGWLLQVPVSNKTSSFGGITEASDGGPDLVILGAVCLSVLRALETHLLALTISHVITVELQTFMDKLLLFLQHHLGWQALAHPCEWVSLVFIEQDDDLLEVARSLLKIYIHCHSFLSPASICPADGKGIWSGSSHRAGSDPHCIFLLLLKNVAFDDSVLLDFLISSETCFLEYFVRYLKLLKEDWPRFCLTCTLFDLSASHKQSSSDDPCKTHSQRQTVSESRVEQEGTSFAHLHKSISVGDNTIVIPAKENTRPLTSSHSSVFECPSSLGSLQLLAEYDSSGDSESECTEQDQSPVTTQTVAADSTDLDKQMGMLELRCPDFHPTPAKAADNPGLMVGTLLKSVRCLLQLQVAIHRLHRKQLFPYNPSALLRLLVHINTLKRQ